MPSRHWALTLERRPIWTPSYKTNIWFWRCSILVYARLKISVLLKIVTKNKSYSVIWYVMSKRNTRTPPRWFKKAKKIKRCVKILFAGVVDRIIVYYRTSLLWLAPCHGRGACVFRWSGTFMFLVGPLKSDRL